LSFRSSSVVMRLGFSSSTRNGVVFSFFHLNLRLMLGLLLERSKARMLGGYSDMAAWKLEREGAGRPEFPSLLAFLLSSFLAS
jgi:hypothetical protein